jgi:hypothetical protein
MTDTRSNARQTSGLTIRATWTHVDKRLWTASAAGAYIGRVEGRHQRFRAIDRINGDLGTFDELVDAQAAVEAGVDDILRL